MKKKKVSNRGAPVKDEKEVILPNGFRKDQWKRLKEEAAARNNMSAALLQRQALDWFFTMLDTKRGDVSASELFDNSEVSTKK